MAPIDKVALALSDPIRLQIMDILARGRTDCCSSPGNPQSPAGLCSCDLLPALDVAPSRLSYHVNQLKEANLILEQKQGRWVYFSLNQQALAEFHRDLQARFGPA